MRTGKRGKHHNLTVIVTLISVMITFSCLSVVFFESGRAAQADIACPEIVPAVIFYLTQTVTVLTYTAPFAVMAYAVCHSSKKTAWTCFALFIVLYAVFFILTVYVGERTSNSFSYMFNDFSLFLEATVEVYGVTLAVITGLALSSVLASFFLRSHKKSPLFVLGGALLVPLVLMICELSYRFVSVGAFEAVDLLNFSVDVLITVLENGVVPYFVGMLLFRILNSSTRRRTA